MAGIARLYLQAWLKVLSLTLPTASHSVNDSCYYYRIIIDITVVANNDNNVVYPVDDILLDAFRLSGH